MWIERLMAGISHQHVLSYNPDVEDKSVVKVYTMEELYGDDWEEKMSN